MYYFTQSYNPNYCTFLLMPSSGCDSVDDSVEDKCTHFVKIAVAPHLPIHKRARQDASLGVKFRPLTHAAPLQPYELSRGGVRHIDYSQAAAGQPHSGPSLSVVHDAQSELAVIIINLFRAGVAIKIDGEKIASVSLKKRKMFLKLIK